MFIHDMSVVAGGGAILGDNRFFFHRNNFEKCASTKATRKKRYIKSWQCINFELFIRIEE